MPYSDFLKKNWAVFLLFFILIFAVYGQSLTGDFVYDDRNIIEYADVLSDTGHPERIIMHPFWNAGSGLYRPVTLMSYAINFAIFGTSPVFFHLFNLILYVLVCFFIYLLIKKLFKEEILAFLSALLFLLLPIHSEVVANITGRGELLALLFSLLTLLEFSKTRPNFWLLGLWMLLAIGSKEVAIAAFPLIFLILYIKEPAPTQGAVKKVLEILRANFREVSSALIAVCFYFFLRFFSLSPANFFGVKTSLIENPLIFTDAGSRVLTGFKVLWMYFEKMLWPSNLCSDYSYNQIPVISEFSDIGAILGLALFSSSIILFFIFIHKKPIISFGLAIFILSFLPVSNLLFATGTIAGERLFFFPSLGFCLIIAFAISRTFSLIRNEKTKLVFGILILALLLTYGFLSQRRQAVWLNEERLFFSAAECAPNSVLSRSNSGAMYLIKGDLNKAEEELKVAMNIKPIYSKGINNLGLVYWKKGEPEKARQLYLQSLRQEFPYPGAYENLVLLYLSEKNIALAKHWLNFLYPGNGKSVELLINNYPEQQNK